MANEMNIGDILNDVRYLEPGECPEGQECPVLVAERNGRSPQNEQDSVALREHVREHHLHLNVIFDRTAIFLLGILNNLERAAPIIRYEPEHKEEEQMDIKCNLCDNYFDHEDHSRYVMVCCPNTFCVQCVSNLKKENKECPSCKNNLDYIEKIPDLKEKDGTKEELEDCHICGEKLNSNQHTGEVIFDCSCKFKLCISCANEILQDKKETKLVNVQGIPGLMLPHEHLKKGKCPQCQEVPKNRDEIISLFSFIPPRR